MPAMYQTSWKNSDIDYVACQRWMFGSHPLTLLPKSLRSISQGLPQAYPALLSGEVSGAGVATYLPPKEGDPVTGIASRLLFGCES